MDSTRLLNSQYHSDDEYTLDQVPESSTTRRAQTPPRQQRRILFSRRRDYHHLPSDPQDQYSEHGSSNDEQDHDSDDLEAPASLLIGQAQDYQDNAAALPQPATAAAAASTRDHVSTYDRTLWRWTNVANMDDFFQRVYDYYLGKGMYCILLGRLLNLL